MNDLIEVVWGITQRTIKGFVSIVIGLGLIAVISLGVSIFFHTIWPNGIGDISWWAQPLIIIGGVIYFLFMCYMLGDMK